jgi:hypothetical protein
MLIADHAYRVPVVPRRTSLLTALPLVGAEPWVTIDEACRIAKVGRRSIYNWKDAGRIRWCYTAGGSLRIDPASLFTTERP